MTAYALQGDNQRCIDAGMDDYITKPLDTRKLIQVLKYWSKRSSNLANEPYNKVEAVPQPDQNAILDLKSALPRFSQDLDFYKTMLAEFVDSLPERLDDMNKALEGHEWKPLSDQAHNLKGVAANFGVMRISVLARKIDEASQAEQADLIKSSIQNIVEAMSDLEIARAELSE